MSDEHQLDVIGTTGAKATLETRRPRPHAEVETLFTTVPRPEVEKRVKAMVRLFHQNRYPELTLGDWQSLPSIGCELVGGDLYVAGRSYGHGAHARALMALLLNPPPEPERQRVSR